MNIGPLELLIGAGGVALLGAAVLNRSPLGVLRTTTAGGAPSDAPPIDSGSGAGGLPPLTGNTSAGAEATPDSAPALVTYRHPSPDSRATFPRATWRMTAATRQALYRWAQALGVPGLFLSGAYRSSADQAAGHAADPTRFAPAGSSWHERGTAVDVDLPAMLAVYGKTTAQVQSAGRLTGWCFSGRSGPMHASIGGCG